MTLSVVKKKSCEGWVPDARCAVYPTGKNSRLQADDADISMVLITGITKFLPAAEVLISPLNLKGWHGVRQRAEAKGSGMQLNFIQAIACHDVFQDPNKGAEHTVLLPSSLETIFPPWYCCRKGEPLPGPKSGLFSNSEICCLRRHTCWQSKRLYWEGVPGQRARGREPRRTALPCGFNLGFYGSWVSFQVVSDQFFWLRVLPGGAYRSTKIDSSERSLGGWKDIQTDISSLL